MKEKTGQLIVLLAIQLLLTGGYFLVSGSVFVVLLSAVAAILVATQLAVCLKKTDAEAKNFLYPSFLLNRPVITSVALLAIAVSSFFTCLALGEQVAQTLPDSDHNNIYGLVSNALSALGIIGALIFIRRSKQLYAFFSEFKPRATVTLTAFYNLALFNVVAFMNVQQMGPFNALFPYHWVSETLNALWLFCFTYLILANSGLLVMQLFQTRNKGSRGLFKMSDLWLLEPIILYGFSLGALSEPGELAFLFFLILGPLVIITFMMLINLLGIRGRDSTGFMTPTITLALFGLGNFIIYDFILAFKFGIPYLAFSLVAVGIFIAVVYLLNYYQLVRKRQALKKKITDLNRSRIDGLPNTSASQSTNQATWYDNKVRLYNELRDLR